MQTIEYIPENWLARAAFNPGLRVYSRPIEIERRLQERIDFFQYIHNLLSTLLIKEDTP